jgi:hypothetical protein
VTIVVLSVFSAAPWREAIEVGGTFEVSHKV